MARQRGFLRTLEFNEAGDNFLSIGGSEIVQFHYNPERISERKEPKYRSTQQKGGRSTIEYLYTNSRVIRMNLSFDEIGNETPIEEDVDSKTIKGDIALKSVIEDFIFANLPQETEFLFPDRFDFLRNQRLLERRKTVKDSLDLLEKWTRKLPEINRPPVVEMLRLDITGDHLFIGIITKMRQNITLWDKITGIPLRADVELEMKEDDTGGFGIDSKLYMDGDGREYRDLLGARKRFSFIGTKKEGETNKLDATAILKQLRRSLKSARGDNQ